MTRYYLDTSIWLDLMEDRNDDLPKGRWARAMFSRIVSNDDTVLVSDVVEEELRRLVYTTQMLRATFDALRPVVERVDAFPREKRRAKDLAIKRDVPTYDALHSLIARNNDAVMVTLDEHFAELDVSVRTPNEV